MSQELYQLILAYCFRVQKQFIPLISLVTQNHAREAGRQL